MLISEDIPLLREEAECLKNLYMEAKLPWSEGVKSKIKRRIESSFNFIRALCLNFDYCKGIIPNSIA